MGTPRPSVPGLFINSLIVGATMGCKTPARGVAPEPEWQHLAGFLSLLLLLGSYISLGMGKTSIPTAPPARAAPRSSRGHCASNTDKRIKFLLLR